jgi:hypothetical protein
MVVSGYKKDSILSIKDVIPQLASEYPTIGDSGKGAIESSHVDFKIYSHRLGH